MDGKIGTEKWMGILEIMVEGWENRSWERDGNSGNNGIRDGKIGTEKGIGFLEILV